MDMRKGSSAWGSGVGGSPRRVRRLPSGLAGSLKLPLLRGALALFEERPVADIEHAVCETLSGTLQYPGKKGRSVSAFLLEMLLKRLDGHMEGSSRRLVRVSGMAQEGSMEKDIDYGILVKSIDQLIAHSKAGGRLGAMFRIMRSVIVEGEDVPSLEQLAQLLHCREQEALKYWKSARLLLRQRCRLNLASRRVRPQRIDVSRRTISTALPALARRRKR